MSHIGDNSLNSNQLRSFIDRIEAVEGEIKSFQEDRKEIYLEAKSSGYDPRIIRKVVALRKMDRQKRIEEEALIETYMSALGELADTPLGRAAIERDIGGGY